MNSSVNIYILCRDRPDYAIECIESVVKSNGDQFEVIVSDNSLGNSVEDMVCLNFPNIKYVRRDPPLSADSHINAIINECDSEYVVLFHDDDRMLDGFISTMLPKLMSENNCAAIACSAYLINQSGRYLNSRLYRDTKPIKTISTYSELLDPYLTILYGYGAPPFPSYIYRTANLKLTGFDFKSAGKHSDLTMLLNLLNTGAIIWLNESLMEYRIHGASDSSNESIPDRLSLLRFINANKMIESSHLINTYRTFFWSKWAVQNRIYLKFMCGTATLRDVIVFSYIVKSMTLLLISHPLCAFKILKKYFLSMVSK